MRGFVNFERYIQQGFYANLSNIGMFRITHDFNGYSIIAKIINNKVYVPVFMDNEVLNIIEREGNIRNADIVCDIPNNFRITSANTSSSILRIFLPYVRNMSFTIVNTNKGYAYKGTKGVILDSDYNPLMICCNTYDIVDNRPKFIGPVCLISPRVFSNTDIISKFIAKSLIPNIHNIKVGSSYPSVIISGIIDDFVNKPKAPECIDFNEYMYSILENHIDEIIDEPQGILQGLDESDTL